MAENVLDPVAVEHAKTVNIANIVLKMEVLVGYVNKKRECKSIIEIGKK